MPKQVGSHVVAREVTLERSMRASADPVGGAETHPDVLLALYGEICASWRALVDVRFKLLGLVPTVSVVALAALLSRSQPGEGLDRTGGVAIACLGLVVTAALAIYGQRNSQLHDELISRPRRIEYELGLVNSSGAPARGAWSSTTRRSC